MIECTQRLILTLSLTTVFTTPLLAEEPKTGDLEVLPRTLTIQGKEVRAELGRLYVPERHSNPGGKLIELAFVRFPSKAENPGPPIVYLAGGPGSPGILIARTARFSVFWALTEVADVIALDQRGTGMTKPSLGYRERWEFPLDRAADRQLRSMPSRRANRLRRKWFVMSDIRQPVLPELTHQDRLLRDE